MPKYLVLEKSLIGNEIFEAGAVVEYDGFPSENLEPTCDEGRAKRAEYEASNKARVALMMEQNAGAEGMTELIAALKKNAENMPAMIAEAVKVAMSPPAGKAGKKADSELV
jgi:hypothetical protein